MSGDDLCSRYGGSSSLMVEEPKQKIDKLILDSGIEGEFYSIKINPKFTPKVHDKIEKIVEPISLKLIRYPRNMNYGVASAIVKMCFYLKIPLIIFDAEESSWRVPTCSTTPEFELLHGDMTISRISIAVRYIAEVVAPEYHSSKLIEEKITTRTSPTEVENLIQQIERQYRYLMWMNRETGPMSFGADSRRLRTRESFEIVESPLNPPQPVGRLRSKDLGPCRESSTDWMPYCESRHNGNVDMARKEPRSSCWGALDPVVVVSHASCAASLQ
eukprot:GHVH01001962.1.p1 GENE.GHVH01001962.1~~GHVH01001962.1.p1  ORF type:complete len:273 (-),score=27.55 GHVH01001962.1:1288-2106(-)